MAERDQEMADEYDFSGGTRGKFYRPGAVLRPPIHVSPDTLEGLKARAEAEGVSVSELADRLLRRELERPDPVG